MIVTDHCDYHKDQKLALDDFTKTLADCRVRDLAAAHGDVRHRCRQVRLA